MLDIVNITLDSMKDIVYIIDREYNILYANPASVAFFRTVINKIIGKKCFEMFKEFNIDCYEICPLRKPNKKEFPNHISIDTIRTANEKFVTKIWKYYSIMFEKQVEGYLIIIEEFTQFPLVLGAQNKIKPREFLNPIEKFGKKNLVKSSNYNTNYNIKVDFAPKTLIQHNKPSSIANRSLSTDLRFLNKKKLQYITERTKENDESWDMAFYFAKLANLVKKQSRSLQKMRLLTQNMSKLAQDLLNHSKTFKIARDK